MKLILLGTPKLYGHLMRRWRAYMTLGALAHLVSFRAAAAEPSEPTAASLTIACPQLDEGARAALEARSRAELASAQMQGEITIECTDRRAVVSLSRDTTGAQERTLPLSPDPAASTDQLLEALHELLAQRTVATVTSGPASAPTASTTSGSQALGPRTEVTRPPADRAVASAHGGGPRDREPPSRQSRSSVRLGVIVGSEAERWRGEIPGAAEAHAGARLLTPSGWSVTVLGGAGLGLESTNGIRARTWRGVLRVDYQPIPEAEIGLGASARLLLATARTSLSPVEQQRWTTSALASARYLWHVGRFTVSAGPQLEILAQPLSVHVNGNEMFRMPRFVGGLSVDGTGDFGG